MGALRTLSASLGHFSPSLGPSRQTLVDAPKAKHLTHTSRAGAESARQVRSPCLAICLSTGDHVGEASKSSPAYRGVRHVAVLHSGSTALQRELVAGLPRLPDFWREVWSPGAAASGRALHRTAKAFYTL